VIRRGVWRAPRPYAGSWSKCSTLTVCRSSICAPVAVLRGAWTSAPTRAVARRALPVPASPPPAGAGCACGAPSRLGLGREAVSLDRDRVPGRVADPSRLRERSAAMKRFARVLATVFICVACLFCTEAVAFAAVTPAPYPATGGSPATWSCTDSSSTDTPPVLGSDCVVTSWGVNPPAPVPSSSSSSALTDDQWQTLSWGVGLLVFFAAAHTIGSWKS
jgi:hypothetical protein